MAGDLVKKMQIKKGQKLIIINSPEGYAEDLGPMPEDVVVGNKPEGIFDFVQIFVKDLAELAKDLPKALKVLKQDGLFWICYPKKTSKTKSDLNRDVLRVEMEKHFFSSVTLISINDTWSAMRFRPTDKVGK